MVCLPSEKGPILKEHTLCPGANFFLLDSEKGTEYSKWNNGSKFFPVRIETFFRSQKGIGVQDSKQEVTKLSLL